MTSVFVLGLVWVAIACALLTYFLVIALNDKY